MLKKIVIVVSIILTLCLISEGTVASSSDIKSSKLDLGNSNYADFVDFLYKYSTKNRLNVQWFGWYYNEKANHWYERADSDSNFKINIHLLTEKNGYLYFSNGFNEKTVNMIIDPGTEKAEWIQMIEDFKKELKNEGWIIEQRYKSK